jgi:hypothetical protein
MARRAESMAHGGSKSRRRRGVGKKNKQTAKAERGRENIEENNRLNHGDTEEEIE